MENQFRLSKEKPPQTPLERALFWLHDTAENAANFLLPPVCLNCHRPLVDINQICPECWQLIDFITPPVCQVTGRPLPFDIGGEVISAAAAANPPAYDQARAVASYDGTMRSLIHKLKYQDRHETISLFALWLRTTGSSLIQQADTIIPIPLHRTRLWQRRFNQSTLIARRLGEITEKKVDAGLLIRNRKTRSQVGLSAKQRKSNMNGAFSLSGSDNHGLQHKNILLIDDVITTGATVNVAAKLLKQKGAKTVNVLALAHTLTE